MREIKYNSYISKGGPVSAEDTAGNEINQNFTLYVTIKDGKKTGTDGNDDEKETGSLFPPKVKIASYRFSKKKIICGQRFRAKIILRNTSKEERVKNMLVSVAPAENVN